MSAYRDDLEAARLRGDDLERELAKERARNQTLEAETASRALAAYRRDRTVLIATRGGRLVFSLFIIALGALTAGSAFAEGVIPAGVIFTIVLGAPLVYMWSVPRVDPKDAR